MAETHILAVHTYGSQRVKAPSTNQTVSAYKIGYSSAACETLLALYGAKARDVSSPHASYRYVQIDGETTVRHGYVLLNVTADELARAEAVREVIAPIVGDEVAITVEGLADTQPLVPNDTAAHKARNRRVEILVLD